MLICNNCGRTIREEDLGSHRDFLSYVGEERYYETNADNCSCGGEFEEAVKCNGCEEYCLDSDMTSGWKYNVRICKGCLNYYKGKYERAYNKLTMNDTEDFVDWLVDINEIMENQEWKR